MPDFFPHALNSKVRYGTDWDARGWLPEGAQITSSTWTPTPNTGITVSGQAISDTGTETSAMIEVTSTGVYTVRNHVTANDGSYGDWDLILDVADTAAVYGYLTLLDAQTRLFTRWRIYDAELAPGDLITAADELDSAGPFIGSRRGGYSQARAFPRTINPDNTLASDTVPDTILDAVARLAYHIAEDADPAITSESVLDRSVSYANPKVSADMAAVRAAIRPYLRRVGSRSNTAYWKHPDDVGWPVPLEDYYP